MAQPEPKKHPSGDNRFKLLDRAITKHHGSGDALIEILHAAQGILNRVEAGIRCYDPCLSCSTHAFGQMPLHVELLNASGEVLDQVRR